MSAHICTYSEQNFNISVNNRGGSISDKVNHNASANSGGQKYFKHIGPYEFYFKMHSNSSFPCAVCLFVYLLKGYAIKGMVIL